MENRIVSIPLDKSKFDKDKIEKAKILMYSRVVIFCQWNME